MRQLAIEFVQSCDKDSFKNPLIKNCTFREAIIPVKSYDFGAAINAGGGGERLVKPAEIKKRRREQSFISNRAQKTMNCLVVLGNVTFNICHLDMDMLYKEFRRK